MELDRVRRHARLTVVVVEEGDPNDAGFRADPRHLPRIAHLLASVRSRADRAERRGRLRDHRPGAAPKDEMVVEVGLAAVEGDGGDDAVDAALERETSRRREALRARQRHEVGDGRFAGGSSRGRSFSVLTPHRSTPQASAAEKCAWRWGAGAATRVATEARRTTTATSITRRLTASRLRRAQAVVSPGPQVSGASQHITITLKS
jgi:hypothetical protein